MFSRALTDIDYQTIIIGDGKRALEWLADDELDLLLLDLHLPHVFGKNVFNSIVDKARFEGTYIVLVTADAPMGGMLQDKADFLLNKPIDILQLQQLASRLKNSPRKRESKMGF